MEKKPLTLTIRIPFCPERCGYCDHAVETGVPSAQKLSYVHALYREMESVAPEMADHEVTSVCVTGGALSSIGGPLLKELLTNVKNAFSVSETCEYVLHMIPRGVSISLLNALREFTGGRPTLRLQFEQETVDPFLHLGLKQTFPLGSLEETLSLMENVPSIFTGVNLLYGLQGQGIPQLRASFGACIEGGVSFLSLAPLRLTPGTCVEQEYTLRQKDASSSPRYQFPSPQKVQAMYEDALSQLENRGYERLTWHFFAKKSASSRLISDTISAVDELGLGLGASSHFDGLQYKNTSSLPLYVSHADDFEKILVSAGPVSDEEEARRYLSRALESPKGISLSHFTARFGKVPGEASSVLKDWEAAGFLVREGDFLRLTPAGACQGLGL
ncbi:MAG: hypothetical protein IJ773_04680 [Lachnospiraceae bacterium]|nr:hypothetical protein [Lachnospiraceae bacterium]